METIFRSKDGIIFEDALACAKHELQTFPEILQQIESKMASVPESFKANWCGGGACGCMGCINRQFYDLDLTKQHWQVWFQEYYKVKDLTEQDIIYNELSCGVIVYNVNAATNRAEIINVLRKECELEVKTIQTVLQSERFVLFNNILTDNAVRMKKAFEEIGIEVKLFKNNEEVQLEQFKSSQENVIYSRQDKYKM